jgi:urease accessory protein
MLHAGMSGLLHPFATPAHVIALAGLALIAGRKKRDAIEIAFALGLAIGLGALAQGTKETPAGDMLLAGAILCSLLAAASVTVPAVLAALLAFLFGIALGLDSLLAAAGSRETVATLIGTACGGVVALALMAFLASGIAGLWQGVVLRAAGSFIAATAVAALVLRWGGL